MSTILRDSFIGQCLRWVTKGNILKYPEEEDNFDISKVLEQLKEPLQGEKEETNTTIPGSDNGSQLESQKENTNPDSGGHRTLTDGDVLVGWYGPTDPENPQNWPTSKKVWVTFIIFIYTFAVYSGSSIYVPGELGLMEEFGVGITKASLGLAIYVLGYGTGPLLFSPLSEIPVLGRNLPYIISMALFVILSVPTALVKNYAGFLVLRFLTGFMGSPCLATGGASMGDLYNLVYLPYGLSIWVLATFCAPALGPTLSTFAVAAEGWRWAFWVELWLAAPVFILMVVSLPETSSDNILLRRAQRIRAVTGDSKYRSSSEIKQANQSIASVAREALIKPFETALLDPCIMFTHLYAGLLYGIYYSFFEVFPLVYVPIYHFTPNTTSLTFIAIAISCVIGMILYFAYLEFYQKPDMAKGNVREQEHRLIPALLAVFFLPLGLFWYAWTARSDIPWIVGIVGLSFFGIGSFLLLQCIFMYLPLSYPMYSASLFAANDFFRAAMATGSILYAHPLFTNLGIGKGVSLLGGLSCLGIIAMWSLFFLGAKLRAMSKFAVS